MKAFVCVHKCFVCKFMTKMLEVYKKMLYFAHWLLVLCEPTTVFFVEIKKRYAYLFNGNLGNF